MQNLKFKTIGLLDIDLVNEIGATLAGAGFVIIWRRRDPAADDLARDVPAHSSAGQGVHRFGNTGGELPPSIGEFPGRPAGAVCMTNDRFSMTHFQWF
jgi:hypothetical protein